jgi:2,3-bisphosphoglycerate-independent phosphoglycerate mutase
MKYVVLVGDGLGDYSYPELGQKSPLEYARTPHLDWLAQHGTLGCVHTIPPGFPPGSDVGNLSLLGYDPERYYSGRAPLEAASMGIRLGPRDLAIRCNLVTLSPDHTIMLDYSAGHIPTDHARTVIRLLQRELGSAHLEFYPGVSYRHILVWRDAPVDPAELLLTPPHEIPDRPIAPHLPQGPGSHQLRELIVRSWEVLAPLQIPANSIWLWGAGRAPHMPTLTERFGLRGSVISAVDLIKGLGVYAGLNVLDVPGATGYLDTNYSGKVHAALEALQKEHFVYLHVEAPDECGHQGRLDLKIRAIEDFDEKIVGPILQGLRRAQPPWALLVTTDHYTPVRERVHVAAPVPFVIYNPQKPQHHPQRTFSERAAHASGLSIAPGYKLFELFLQNS